MAVDVDAGPDLALLKVVAEPSRLAILQLLADEDLCVCHLVEELGVEQPLVSHHLRVLREAGLVSTERYRYWTYYRLEPTPLAELAGALSGLTDRSTNAGDRRRPCC